MTLLIRYLQNHVSFIGLLCLLILAQTLILFVNSEYVLTEAVYKQSLGSQLTDHRIIEVLENQRALGWMNYLYAPVYYPLKIVSLFAILFAGLFLYDIKVNSATVLKVIAVSELILLIGVAVKSFIFLNTDFTLKEFWNFKPLSILYWMDKDGLPQWAIFPLGMLNVFHLLSLLMLIYGVKASTTGSYQRVERSVILSYTSALLLLIVISIYLSIVSE